MTEKRYGNIYDGVAQSEDAQNKYESHRAYRDKRTAYIVATRGVVPVEVAMAWVALAHPMNQSRAWMNPAVAMEVAAAYNLLFSDVLAHPEIGTWPWVLTLEEDNIPPQLGLEELFTAVYCCVDCGEEISDATWQCPNGHAGLDAISGLYHTKSDPPYPMAYGDPAQNVNGKMEFWPRSVKAAIAAKSVIEVNGIGMGFALWRTDLFRRMEHPWFATKRDAGGGATQDMAFCRKAKETADARFGVHCGVSVIHMDPKTGRRW